MDTKFRKPGAEPGQKIPYEDFLGTEELIDMVVPGAKRPEFKYET